MKQLFIAIAVLGTLAGSGQAVKLSDCITAARKQHPMLEIAGIAEAIGNRTEEISKLAFFPRLAVNAQATYQSDVTRVDVPIPNVDIPYPSNDQYRATLDLVQPIYDGGSVTALREQIRVGTALQKQQTEVQLGVLDRQVTNLFGAILLSDQNNRIISDAIATLSRQLSVLKKVVEHGAAKPADVDLLEAEVLTLKSQQHQLDAKYAKLVETMSLLCGRILSPDTRWEVPGTKMPDPNLSLNRPELVQFDLQQKKLKTDDMMSSARARPRLSAFIQGGYGRPGLNMLDDSFQPFYVAGLRFDWQLSALYTRSGESEINGLQQQLIDEKKSAFELGLNAECEQLTGQINALVAALEDDKQIIRLRERVAEDALSSLEAGSGKLSDYLVRLRELRNALMQRNLHDIQLGMYSTKWYLTSGNSINQ